MKQLWKRRKEAWHLSVHKRLGMAAVGAFLGTAGLGGLAQAQPLFADNALRPAQELEQVRFALTLPLNHQDELNALIAHLYTPGDPQFHHFLGSAEFDARFAPTQQQYETLKSLARQYGLTITGEHSSRTLLDVAAPASTIRNVFGTQMQLMQEVASGRQYYAPDREAAAPFPLAALGAEVAALQQKPRATHIRDRRPVSEAVVNAAAQPHAGTSASGSYGPADIKAAYNLGSIQNGGQTVALYELSSAHYADSSTYASQFGLSNTSLVQKTVDGGTTDISGSTEVMLDIEMLMAISNPATIYVYTGPNSATGALDTYTQIANDDLVNQVSTSWGLCESSEGSTDANAENTVFTKMVAEGMALFAAAGDSGAYDCGGTRTLAVDDPASQPNVTGVGGTSLTTTSTQAYTSEKVWDTSSTEGGGGGISTLWSIPSYQQGIVSSAPSGQFSTTMRNVPDVSLDADPNTGYYIYDSDGGGWGIVGGTSAAAPLWAGFWSLTGKGLANAGVSPARAGFANAVIYPIAKNATKYASDFHDVSTGTNNHYSAVAGYDDATGWGSFNGASLYADVLASAGGGSSSSGGGSSSSSSSGGSSSSSSSSSSGGSSSSSSSGGSSSGGSGAPAAPTGLTASGTRYGGAGAVILNWNASAKATRYYVYAGTSSHGESSTPLGYVTSPGAEVTGLSQYATYYFEVKAYDSAGYSPYSNEASATTK
jgi:kumamolisin